MIAVIPACFGPGEALAESEQGLVLTLRAAREAGKAAGRVLICTDDDRLAHEVKCAGFQTALAHTVTDEESLPRGSRQALLAAGQSGGPRLLLDPRNPLLDASHLRLAMARFAGCGAPYLVSASVPEDHPCQGKLFYSFKDMGTIAEFGLGASPLPAADLTHHMLERIEAAVPGARLRGVGLRVGSDGAALLADGPDGCSYLALVGDTKTCGQNVCEVYEPTGSGRIACRAVDSDLPLFRLAKRPASGFGVLTWMLLTPMDTPGAFDLRGNFEPEGAPWETDPKDQRTVNAITRAAITGRQDFPEVYTLDGTLAVLAPGVDFPDPACLTASGFEIFVLDARQALRVTTPLDMLKYETLMENQGRVS